MTGESRPGAFSARSYEGETAGERALRHMEKLGEALTGDLADLARFTLVNRIAVVLALVLSIVALVRSC